MEQIKIKYIVLAEDDIFIRQAVMDRLELATSGNEILISGTQDPEKVRAALTDPEAIVILDGSVAILAKVDLKSLDRHRVIAFSGCDDFLAEARKAGLPAIQKGAKSELLTQMVLSMAGLG